MNNKTRLNLFKTIYKIRKVEETISKLYSENEMRCPVHLSIGQEAVASGVCSNLKEKDEIISTHRSHAHYIAKGGNLNSMISEIYGKKSGCALGIGGSMHLQDLKKGINGSVPIVGSTIPIGVGIALFNKLKKKNNVVTIFFGEGATEEGVFHESINFAGLHNLPILFVCENNLYSVYTGLKERQPKQRSLKKICEGNSLAYYHGDGNDVIKVHNKVKKIIKNMRKNNQPSLIELGTYRWLEHCGPNWDDNLRYRPIGELKKWIKKCPLAKIKKLINDQTLINRVTKEVDKEINSAFVFAKNSKFPSYKITKNFYF